MTIGHRRRATRRPPPPQRGIALLLVLWVLALLTIIAVGLTAAQRTESALATNQLATARFHAAAEAGVGWAVLNLLAPPTAFDQDADSWLPNGTPRAWSFAGETLEIQVTNEASRIDLNKASRNLLEALIKAVGLAPEEASAVADAIEDWRDPDNLTGLNGAEDGDYEDAGRSYGAKDGPFDSVEELQQVLGVDRSLYRALAPALTVDSGRAKPDPKFASPLVQAALEGTTLEQEVRSQEEDIFGDLSDLDQATGGRGGPLYRIRITSLHDGERGPGMEALVRVEARMAQPFKILWRRFGLIAAEPILVPGEQGE